MTQARDSLETVFADLRSGWHGLTTAEAVHRFVEYGPNSLAAQPQPHWLRRFLREFSHFFALILWLAAGLSLFAEWRDPGQGMGTLGAAIVCVILINGGFSFWQEFRAEQAIEALQRMLPSRVKVLRDGGESELDADQLVPGDVILLSAGDAIPADGRVLESTGLKVDNAPLTGESRAVGRSATVDEEEDLAHAGNVLLAGATVVAGQARMLVFATGMHTRFGAIARLTGETDATESPLQREIGRLSRWVALLACGIGIAFFLVGLHLQLSFWENLIFAIGIIVANVPEGLLPTVTLSLAMATRRMARRNALVRHLPAVETLGATTVIVSDKTGTLTENRMSAVCVVGIGGESGIAALAADDALRRRYRHLLDAAGYCHDLHRVKTGNDERLLGDPMEVALGAMPGVALSLDGGRLAELPFDTRRRRQSVVVGTPSGRALYCKGALEAVLPLCDLVDGGGRLREADRQHWIETQRRLASRGWRVIAFAWRQLEHDEAPQAAERNLVFCGLVGLADPPRAEVPEAMAKCAQAGIRVIMCTGDHPETAAAIAREIGLLPSSVAGRFLLGRELDRISNTQLQLLLDEPHIHFARMSPEHKLRVVRALKRKNEVVAVTGDGVNDAPALKMADVGVAMGRSGTDVARQAADMVLLDDNFATIVVAIEEGRAVYANIRRFLTYILTSNVPELIPYIGFALFRIPLPLTVVQILAVDLGTDMLPALALGAEPPASGLMNVPPRGRDEQLLSTGLLLRAYAFLGVMEAVIALTAFFAVLHAGGWQYGMPLASDAPLYLAATTACLAGIIAGQVVNVFLCRHETQSVFRLSLATNPLLWGGIAVELMLLALITGTSWGNALFGAAPLPAWVLLLLLPLMVAMLVLEEARKAWLRRGARAT